MPRHRCQIIPLPVSPIERLVVEYRKYLHIPDSALGPLYTLAGAVAANVIEGPPVWLMLVGPPSCGKSELLNSLLTVPQVIEAADINGETAFLSGSPAKDKVKDATGGILRQIGDHGGLILNDFTSILSKTNDKQSSIMSVLREAYGGRWTRHIGGEGGRSIQWTGKLAVFAGCTGVIDQQHATFASLGERWVFCRYDGWRDCFQEISRCLDNDRGGWQETLRGTVKQFFLDLGLEFGKPVPRREFSITEKLRLHRLAMVAVRCRSAVSRDAYTKEVTIPGESELCTRLGAVLGQLLVGMDAIGASETMRWRLLHRVAMDSMPSIRRLVVEAVLAKPQPVDAIRRILRCGESTTKRVVEDLEVHDIVSIQNQTVCLSDWMREHYHPPK